MARHRKLGPGESVQVKKKVKTEGETPISNTGNPNKEICKFLNELADHERNVVRNIHKSNVYRKASSSIASHPLKISNGKEAQKLPGVGKKIGLKIDEFLATGHLKKLDKIRDDPTSQAIQLLASVVGIGPSAAQKYVANGVTTIEELAKQSDLNHTQRIGVNHYNDFNERIPREEVEKLRARFLESLKKVSPKFHGEVCGSFRRGSESSGDMDVLITHDDYTSDCKPVGWTKFLKMAVEGCTKDGLITDVMSLGQSKFMGVCIDSKGKYRRIDLRLWPKDQFPAGLLYFTGSDELNKKMRRKAIEMSLMLNEYGICAMGADNVKGAYLPVSSERDIFDILDMKYLPPEER